MKRARYDIIPIKISLLYTFAGALWILFSDEMLYRIVGDPGIITRIEIFKGWFFVGVTALMLYGILRSDMSAARQFEQALKQSEEKFAMLVENTSCAIFIHRGKLLLVNHATEVLTGYGREELLEMNLYDIVHPEYRQRMKSYCDAFTKKGEGGAMRCEFRIVRKDGGERWVDFTSSVMTYGGIIAGLGTAFDITEKQHALAALRESEERFRLLVERVTDYEIFMLDPDGRIVLWNVGAERSKGYRTDEVLGKPHSMFFTQEDIERGVPELELKTAFEKGRFEDEGWRVRKDGSLFWANVVTTAVRDEEGALRGYAKVIRDITERKKAEESLKESEERYRIIAETASDAIITIDEESTVIFANAAVEKIFGCKPAEITGQKVTVLMPERFRRGHLLGVQRYLREGRRTLAWEALELPGLHRNGQEIPLEISYGAFRRGGKFLFTGIVRDVTERKQAEKEKEYRDMLERFTQELETLVAERTMSLMALKLADRVRTPAAVIGWTGRRILEKRQPPEKEREDLVSIVGEADKLETIVRDFQVLLKSKQSMFGYEDINEIVRSVLSLIESEAARKGITVKIALYDGPLRMNVQKDLLRMAIFNILKNALESTPGGGTITVITSGDGNSVFLSVSDTGHGISKEILNRIFDPFFSTKVSRFGMGLPLIKQIVSEHLGEISVESEEGKGTTFRVTFPVRWLEKAAR